MLDTVWNPFILRQFSSKVYSQEFQVFLLVHLRYVQIDLEKNLVEDIWRHRGERPNLIQGYLDQWLEWYRMEDWNRVLDLHESGVLSIFPHERPKDKAGRVFQTVV